MKRRWFLTGFTLSLASASFSAGCSENASEDQSAVDLAVDPVVDPAAVPAAESEQSDIQVVRNDKTLVMATTPNYPPYEQIAGDAQELVQESAADPLAGSENSQINPTIVGFDIDIAKLIADRLGRQLQVIELSFDALIPALVENKVDIAMAALEPNSRRKQLVDFSDIYYRSRHALVSIGGNLRSRDLSYQTIGVRSGSVQARFVQKLTKGEIPSLNIEAYDSLEQLFEAVDIGEIEGAIVEANLADDYLPRYPDFGASGMPTEEATGSAIALAKNSPLRRDINAALSEIKASGEMDQLIARWFD